MGAWIEIGEETGKLVPTLVAPVWGRGLKYLSDNCLYPHDTSPPYGGVD